MVVVMVVDICMELMVDALTSQHLEKHTEINIYGTSSSLWWYLFLLKLKFQFFDQCFKNVIGLHSKFPSQKSTEYLRVEKDPAPQHSFLYLMTTVAVP